MPPTRFRHNSNSKEIRINKLKCAVVVASLLAGAVRAEGEGDDAVSIIRNGAQASVRASPEFFSGDVRLDSLFKGSGAARIGGGVVTFEPAARTAWHTHPLGQTLFVTAGVGWVQQWDQPIREIKPGDIVWIPPGVKHWHGASATVGMTHLAFAEQLDGSTVQWMEKVSDAQYFAQ